MRHYHPSTINGESNPLYKARYKPKGTEQFKPETRAGSRRKTKTIEFIAWDGEGADGRYILLRNSRGQWITDTDNGLSTIRSLDFLVTSASSRHGQTRCIHVIFGGGYDVNMLLRDVPRKTLFTLWHTGHCQYEGYRLSWKPRKNCTITRPVRNRSVSTTPHQENGERSSIRNESITLWDVYGFFQCSFVKAMKQYIPTYDTDKLDNIIRHKAQRSTFKAEELDEIQEYCGLEIDALVEIMQNVQRSVETCELSLARWDGAGAVAAALLRKYRVKEHMQDFAQSYPDVRREAWRAYSGGRIEALQYGRHNRELWHGDINSAYPSAIVQLPSFASGEWIRTYHYRPGVHGLWRVRWDYSRAHLYAPFYPFFYRDKSGSISYPVIGRGAYWSPEIEVALKWMPEGLEIEEGWIWQQKTENRIDQLSRETSLTLSSEYTEQTTENTTRPFAFVPEIYQQRLRFKQEHNAAQMILKLGMNSLYGKLAQTVGYNGKAPATQQIEWAGWITSSTRARLFDVAMQHPLSCLMFSTDGLFSTEPHTVECNDQLGGWSVDNHDEIVIAQSGVYWYRDGNKWTDKTRGYDKDNQDDNKEPITRERVLNAYATGEWIVQGTSTRFITLGLALSSPQMWAQWRQWPTLTKDCLLLAHGTKRVDVQPFWTPADNPSLHLFRTLPKINELALSGELSAIYKKRTDITLDRRLDREQDDGNL